VSKPKTNICHCGKKYTIAYDFRTGFRKNKECPSCQLKLAVSKPRKEKQDKSTVEKESKRRTPRQKAQKEADDWFSRWVRINFAFQVTTDGTPLCKCYTCGCIRQAKQIQNGHFQRRGYKKTRFHENDGRPQCGTCNSNSGEFEKFEIHLIEEIGKEAVEELKILAQQTGEDNEIFYREQSEKYKSLTLELVKNKGIKKWWK
jgi:hypothetical protein